MSVPSQIATHAGPFHADDVLAGAVLGFLFDAEIVRIDRANRELVEDAKLPNKILFDLGDAYQHRKYGDGVYDHHQKEGAGKRENGIEYASAGLIWKNYGEKFCTKYAELIDSKKINPLVIADVKNMPIPAVDPREIADYLEKVVVQSVDAFDTGSSRDGFRAPSSTFDKLSVPTLSTLINHRNPRYFSAISPDKYNQSCNMHYAEARSLALSCLMHEFELYSYRKLVERSVLDQYEPGNPILEISENLGIRRPDVWSCVRTLKLDQVLFAVHLEPDGRWHGLAIPRNDGEVTNEFKILFPDAWRGKRGEDLVNVTGIQGGTFCHKDGMLVAGNTAEAVRNLVEKALQSIDH